MWFIEFLGSVKLYLFFNHIWEFWGHFLQYPHLYLHEILKKSAMLISGDKAFQAEGRVSTQCPKVGAYLACLQNKKET